MELSHKTASRFMFLHPLRGCEPEVLAKMGEINPVLVVLELGFSLEPSEGFVFGHPFSPTGGSKASFSMRRFSGTAMG